MTCLIFKSQPIVPSVNIFGNIPFLHYTTIASRVERRWGRKKTRGDRTDCPFPPKEIEGTCIEEMWVDVAAINFNDHLMRLLHVMQVTSMGLNVVCHVLKLTGMAYKTIWGWVWFVFLFLWMAWSVVSGMFLYSGTFFFNVFGEGFFYALNLWWLPIMGVLDTE